MDTPAQEISYYILFGNYTQGLALQALLKQEGLTARIAPTPRNLEGSQPCGMSLLVRQEDIDAVRACIEKHDAEYLRIVEAVNQIRPGRNRFC